MTSSLIKADILPAETYMGAVRLRVKNFKAVYDFYTQGVGLRELGSAARNHAEAGQNVGANAVLLGLGERPVLILEHDPELRHPARTDAGLFHVAVLFDSPADLAKSLVSTFTRYRDYYTGAGDHLVSQAFYFSDPEGNGVELYYDRPRETWTWNNGHVAMDTLYIDPAAFIRQHLNDEQIARSSMEEISVDGHVGHVHLQVGNVPAAHDFYVKTLGFEETSRLGNSALFVSAGAYHHHMAMNTWNSSGAGPCQKTLGLGKINLVLPTPEALALADDRLKVAGFAPSFDGQTLNVPDPWNNQLSLRSL